MKKLRLRSWVKVVLLVLVFIVLLVILKKTDDDFMNNCMSKGYSKEYCEMGR